MPLLSRIRVFRMRARIAGAASATRRFVALVTVPTLAVALAACGGGGASPGSGAANAGANPTATGAAAGAGAASTPASGGSGPNACAIVTTAQLQQATGTTFAAGQSKPSLIGGSTCNFFATTGAGDGSVVVQVTPQPDLYFPKSNDASFNDLVPLTAPTDRGWVTKPDPSDDSYGHILVVRNGVGVDIAILSAKSVTLDGEQALASSIASQL